MNRVLLSRPCALASLPVRLLLAAFLPLLALPARALSPVAYSLKNGEQIDTYSLLDETYNGVGSAMTAGSALSGGVGQLADGAVGADDVATDLGNGAGFEWVGWAATKPVITFDLGEAQPLENIALHACNRRAGYGLFGTATIEFSTDGIDWAQSAGTAVSCTTSDDARRDARARFITIPFEKRTARYVRVTLTDGWESRVLLSEVEFNRAADAVRAPRPRIAAGGSFLGSTEVAITAPEGAAIYFTRDGSVPTYPATGTTTAYTKPFAVAASTVVRAIAVRTGERPSEVAVSEFQRIDGTGADRWAQTKVVPVQGPLGAEGAETFRVVEVGFAAGMRTDFGDVRFSDTARGLLEAWPVRFTAGVAATFVVRMPARSASVTQHWGTSNAKAAGWQPVFWTDPNGTVADGSRLVKHRWTDNWDADAVSLQTIAGDGGLRFRFSATSGGDMVVGLDETNDGAGSGDARYAFLRNSANRVYVYEQGNARADLGVFSMAEEFRIEREGSVVRYYVDDLPVYTSNGVGNVPLHADAAIHTRLESVESVELLGCSQWGGAAEHSNRAFWAPPAAAEWQPVTWRELLGVTAADGVLTRSRTGSGWGYAGASSGEVIPGDGGVRFRFGETTNRAAALGLSPYDRDAGYGTIAYSLIKETNGRLGVYEYGSRKVDLGTIDLKATYEIVRTGDRVRYLKNGTELHASTARSAGPLLVDASFYSSGETLVGAEVMGARVWRGIGTSEVASPWGFTRVNGPVWRYRKFDGAGFTDLTFETAEERWRLPAEANGGFPSVETAFGGRAALVPGEQNTSAVALGWTADRNLRVRIHGFIVDKNGDGADGTAFELRRDKALLDQRNLPNGGSAPLDLITRVNAGETLNFIVACNQRRTGDDIRIEPRIDILEECAPAVALPVIGRTAGLYNESIEVPLEVATAGATLRYTLDGSEPTETTGTAYAAGSPVVLRAAGVSQTLSVRAFKTGMSPSDVVRATFLVEPRGATGWTREVWSGLGGGTIDDLVLAYNFPSRPTFCVLTADGLASADFGAFYGTRLRGYVLPPQTGEYTFWVVADERAHLFLSCDEDPAHKTRIASIERKRWGGSLDWAGSRSQQSIKLQLVAGRRYYIEVLQKVSDADDKLAVGWQLPDGTLERPIPAARLQPFGLTDTPSYLPAPTVVPAGGSYTAGEKIAVGILPLAADVSVRYTLDGSDIASASQGLAYTPGATIPIAGDTTLKVRCFRAGVAASDTTTEVYSVGELPAAMPTANLRLWLRADAGVEYGTATVGAQRIARWRDRSGNGSDATQAVEYKQAVRIPGALNGRAVVRFDGTDDGMLVDPALVVGRPSTVVAAYRPLAGNSGRMIQSATSSNEWFVGPTNSEQVFYAAGWVKSGAPCAVDTAYVCAAVSSPTGSRFLLNGQDLTASSAPLGVLGAIALGGGVGRNDAPASVDLAELLVFDRVLTEGELDAVQSSLAVKYAAYQPHVAPPEIAPASGRFAEPVSVSIADSTPGAKLYYTLDGVSDPKPGAAGTREYTEPFTVAASTTVRAIAVAPGYSESAVTERRYEVGTVALPIATEGLKLWLRADVGLTRGADKQVSRWGDLSGNGNDASQTETIRQPLWAASAINGQPAVRFDGSDDGLLGDARLDVGGPATIFVVYQQLAGRRGSLLQSGSGKSFMLGTIDNSGSGFLAKRWVRQHPIAANTPLLSSIVCDTTAGHRYFLNGEEYTREEACTEPLGRVALGGGVGAYNSPGNGDVAEVIVYARALSDTERQEVERYLAERYALYQPRAAAPIASPDCGRYDSAQQVRLVCGTSGASIRYTLDGSDLAAETDGQAYSAERPITVSGKVTLKARAFRQGFLPSCTTVAQYDVSTTAPAIAGEKLSLWLRADGALSVDNATGRVVRWGDESGRGNDALQPEAAAQASLVSGILGGKPALRFTARGQGYRVEPTLDLGRPSTVFVVYQRRAGYSGSRMLQGLSTNWTLGVSSSEQSFSASGNCGSLALANDTPALACAVQHSDNSEFFVNGADATADRTPIGTAGRLVINGSGSNEGMANVDIAEIIVYATDLAAAERRAVESYLTAKYGIVLAVPEPAILPNGGAYNAKTAPVSIADSLAGAVIRYTTDGSAPVATSPQFTGPLVFTAPTTTLKARAFSGTQQSGVASATFLVAPTVGVGSAGVLVERYSFGNSNPGNLEGMLRHSLFAGRPHDRFFSTTTQVSAGFSYSGTVLRGYLVAPVTGDYRFGFYAYNDGQLLLGTGDSPSGAVVIARSNGGRGWDSNLSASVHLEAGRRYYLEARMYNAYYTGGIQIGVILPDQRKIHPLTAVCDLDNDPANGAEYVLLQPYGAADIPGRVRPPVITPYGATFSDAIEVAIAAPTAGNTIRYTLDGTEPTADSPVYDQPLRLAQSATVKARAFVDGAEPSEVITGSFVRDDLAGVARGGLRLWLRADRGVVKAENGFVTTWLDQSGEGRHASQGNVNNLPALNPANTQFGGQPTITFDGRDDSLLLPGIPAERFTAFIVFSRNSGGNSRSGPFSNRVAAQRGFQLVNDGGASNSYQPHLVLTNGDGEVRNLAAATAIPVPFTAPSLQVWTSAPQFFRDGGAEPVAPSAQGGFATNSASAIVGAAFNAWAGDIAELLVFDRELSDAERTSVEAYLARRYSLTRTVSAPRFSPDGGIVAGETSVAISSPTAEAIVRYSIDGSDLNGTGDGLAYTGPITIGATTRVKARAFVDGLARSPQVETTFTVDPAAAAVARTGMLLWLRADTGVSLVGTGLAGWADQSGLRNDAVQPTTGNRPTVVAEGIAGRPAVSFSGSGQFVSVPAGFNNFTEGVTAFVVARPTASKSWSRFFDFGNGANAENILWARRTREDTLAYHTYAGSSQTGELAVRGCLPNGSIQLLTLHQLPNGLATIFRNGITQGSITLGVPRNVDRTSNFIGRSNWSADEYFQGETAEMIFYNTALTPSDRIAVEDYLRGRYGIAANTVATPVISPAGGFKTPPLQVRITSATPDATIRYTVDGSDPDEGNPAARPYTAAFELASTTTVRARAVKADMNDSSVATVRYLVGDAPGDGDGLAATYFDNDDFTGTSVRRRDPVVDFDFKAGSPDADLGGDSFAARWTGELQPQFDETYTFRVQSDDGARLWVDLDRNGSFDDNERLIDTWTVRGSVSRASSPVQLSRGQRYPLKLEYVEASSSAAVRLLWSSASTAEQIIPRTQLYSGLDSGDFAQTPQLYPAPVGTFADVIAVTLTATPATATIRYTLDGSEPGENSPLYNGPIEIAETATLKARADAPGWNASGLREARYVVDNAGPVLSALTFEGAVLPEQLVRSGLFRVDATDSSGVARVDFLLDGKLLASDVVAADGFTAPFTIGSVADGLHTLAVQAWDNFGRASAVLSQTIRIEMAPPPAPTITAPANGTKTNKTTTTLLGRAQPGNAIAVLRGGTKVATTVAGADGGFSAVVDLAAGANVFTATASNRNPRPSAPSTAVTVTYDNTVPSPAQLPVARARAGGRIELSWQAPSGGLFTGFYLFRSAQPIPADASLAPADALGGGMVRSQTYTDTPATDQRWYYRIVTGYQVGNEVVLSTPSAEVDAVADRVAPTATVELRTLSAPTSGDRMGRGLVQVTLRAGEKLANVPFLNLAVGEGRALFVDLAVASGEENAYTGTVRISENTAQGAVGAVFSALDGAGNRGDQATLVAPVVLDSAGPQVTAIVPVRANAAGSFEELPTYTSIRNDPAAPAQLALRLRCDEPVQAAPAVTATLSTGAATPLPCTVTDAGDADPLTWLATLTLPASAGAETETLTLGFAATDDLGNGGSTIQPPHEFQVYQGTLPPLGTPAGFTATAKPAGEIMLAWNEVENAAAYVLQVAGPAPVGQPAWVPQEKEFSDLEQLSANTYAHTPKSDGLHVYRVASVRHENGQFAYSGWAEARATADRVPPTPPSSLMLQVATRGMAVLWMLPDLADIAGYALYRGDAAIDASSLGNLVPVAADIPATATSALDPKPKAAPSYYALVALDRAGNRSAPVQGYVNTSLLPVASIAVKQVDADDPVLSWTNAPGCVLSGFNVLLDGVPVSIGGKTLFAAGSSAYTDSSYNGGGRRYTVRSLDAENSRERSLDLPALEVSLPPGAVIRKGVANQLGFRVRNRSAHPVVGGRLSVRVGDHDHASAEHFDLPAEGEAEVRVVVGGYESLPAVSTPLVVTCLIEPAEGERVELVRHLVCATEAGSLQAELLPGEFIRGGEGKVRFRLTNPSAVPLELVVARQSGAKPSDEVRVQVLDAKGALLAQAPLHLPLGLRLANGTSIVRLAPGETYTSPAFAVPVPLSAPALVKVLLQIDAVYYNCGEKGTEIRLPGPGALATASTIETNYAAELTTITPELAYARQPIVIKGRARWRGLDPALPAARAQGVQVVVHVVRDAFARKATVTTDADGSFSYTFVPELAEAGGVYAVWASHPEVTAASLEPRQFRIAALVVSPRQFDVRVPRNYRQVLPVQIATGAGGGARNVRAELVGDTPAALVIATEPLAELAAGATAQLPLSLMGTKPTAGSLDYGALTFRILSDGPDGETLAWDDVTVRYALSDAQPSIVATPTPVQFSVQSGAVAAESVTIENKGYAALENATVQLVPGSSAAKLPDWISLTSATSLGAIDVGGSCVVTLGAKAPSAAIMEGVYYSFFLRVSGTNAAPFDIPCQVLHTPSGRGSLVFKVQDAFAGYSLPDGAVNNNFEGVPGANIVLEKEGVSLTTTPQTYGGRTDAKGELLLSDLPAGRYKLRVEADKHSSFTSRVTVKAGMTDSLPVFLDYGAVTFDWEVVPVTFQDRYEIVLKTTFETNVPTPVIVMEPGYINVQPMCAGQTQEGEIKITNHGLVSAQASKLKLPADNEHYSIELLGSIPESIRAKESVKIPYRLRCLKAFPGDCSAETVVGVIGTESGSGSGTGSVGSSGSGGEGSGSTIGSGTIGTGTAGSGSGTGSGGSLGSSSGTGTGSGTGVGSGSGSASGSGSNSGSGSGSASGGAAGSGYSATYAVGGCVEYSYVFYDSNGCPHNGIANTCYGRSNQRSGGGGGGGGGVWYLTPSGGSGGPGGTGVPSSGGSWGGTDDPCRPDPDFDCPPTLAGYEALSDCEKSLLSECRSRYAETGSWVDLPTRQYLDYVTDMEIPVEGGSVDVDREYRYRRWRFRITDELFASCNAPATYVGAQWYLVLNGRAFGPVTQSSVARTDVSLHNAGDAPEGVYHNLENSFESITRLADGTFTWTDGRGSERRYDRNARLLTRKFHGRLIAEFHYDGEGRLETVADNLGRTVLTCGYTNGRLTSVTDVAKRTVGYDYDSTGRLETVSGLGGESTVYSYDEFWHLTSKRTHLAGTTADKDHLITIAYKLRPLAQQAAAAPAVTANGAIVSTGAVIAGSFGSLREDRTPAERYSPAAVMVDNEIIRGFVTEVVHNTGRTRRMEYGYSAATRQFTAFVRDAEGREEQHLFDSHGVLIAKARNGETIERIEQDAKTRVTTRGDQRVVEEFDSQRNLVRRTEPDGAITSYAYDPVLRKIVRKTDPMGVVTEYRYDDRGNLTATIEALGTADQRTVSTTYVPGTDRPLLRTWPDGSKTSYEYFPDGTLQREYDPDRPEDQTTYTYDSLRRMLSSTDALGRTTKYEYDDLGNVTKVTNPRGEETVNTYVGANLVQTEVGRLTVDGVAKAPGRIKRFAYDAEGHRSEERTVLEDGSELVEAIWTYDSDGRLVGETNALGQTLSYGYDASGNRSLVQTPNSTGGLAETKTTYDRHDRPAEIVDAAGMKTSIAYDLADRATRIVQGVGSGEERSTVVVYDRVGRPLESTQWSSLRPLERATVASTYDRLGRRVKVAGNAAYPTAYEYDAAGRVRKETDAAGQTHGYEYEHGDLVREKRDDLLVASYTYDLVGNRLSVTGVTGEHRHYRYDELNRLVAASIPLAADVAIPERWWELPAFVLNAVAYNRFGEVGTVTAYTVVDGQTRTAVKTYAYNTRGLRTSETTSSSAGTSVGAAFTVSFDYDKGGNLIRTTYPAVAGSGSTLPTTETIARSPYNAALVESVTDRAGAVVRYAYDGALRRFEETNALGGITRRRYDLFGRVVETRDYFDAATAAADILVVSGDPAAPTLSFTLPATHKNLLATRTSYDAADRPIEVVRSDHVAGTSERIETFVYDARGQLLSKGGAGDYPVAYEYDSIGRLTKMTDANKHETSWSYTRTDDGRTEHLKTYANQKSERYTFDLAGRLVERRDAYERKTIYRYNAYGLVAEVDYPKDKDLSFGYDQQGRRISMTDGSGTTSWTYDAFGRTVSETQSRAGRMIVYDQDVEGRRTAMSVSAVDATGGAVGTPWTTTYGYDNAGRLSSVRDGRVVSGHVYRYGYAPASHWVARIELPEGQFVARTPDRQGRIVAVETKRADATVFDAFTYGYDRAGRRETEATPDKLRTFGYDEHDQLRSSVTTGADKAPELALDYQYDPIGNRRKVDRTEAGGATESVSYASNAANQYTSITGAGVNEPGYDDNGNVTAIDGRSLSWDEENRLISATDGFHTTVYVYDGFGRRVEKAEYEAGVLKTTSRYVYDGWCVVEELAAGGTSADFVPVRSYTRGLDLSGSLGGAGGIGGLLAITLQPPASGEFSAVSASYVYDGNGNVAGLLGEHGEELARYRYDPFGQRLVATGAWADLNPYQFSSKERDAATGFYYFGCRYYSPRTGCWLSRDPIAEAGGLNLYGYLGNSTPNGVDPLGQNFFVELAKGVVVGAVTTAVVVVAIAALPEALAVAATVGLAALAVKGIYDLVSEAIRIIRDPCIGRDEKLDWFGFQLGTIIGGLGTGRFAKPLTRLGRSLGGATRARAGAVASRVQSRWAGRSGARDYVADAQGGAPARKPVGNQHLVSDALDDAAIASRVRDLGKYVDGVLYEPAAAKKTWRGAFSARRREIVLYENAFDSSNPYGSSLLTALHELVHAQQFERYTKLFFDGDYAAAAESWIRKYNTDDSFMGRLEAEAYRLSIKRIIKYLDREALPKDEIGGSYNAFKKHKQLSEGLITRAELKGGKN